MLHPRMSIILPVYNVENYIEKSILSVLNQSYIDFELLVVNDGTPDSSIEVAEQFNDTRIKIFHKENGGLSDARNYGLERAKGEYVYFMDSDDWIEPNLLEECISVLEDRNLDIVVFGYVQDNEDSDEVLLSSKEFIPGIDIMKRGSNKLFDSQLMGILGYAWNKVYKRSLLVNNSITFEKGTSLIEDVLFNTQVYQKVDQLNFINEALYHYVNRPILTLVKQFNLDIFDLKVRRSQCLEQFYNNWNIQNRKEIIAYSLLESMKGCMQNMYYTNRGLADQEISDFIKGMFNHERTKLLLPYYKPRNIKDLILKICVRYKLISLFNYLIALRKK